MTDCILSRHAGSRKPESAPRSRPAKTGSTQAHVKLRPVLTAPSLPPLPKPSWWNRVSSFNRYARDLELNPNAQSTRDSFHAIEKKELAEGYE